MICEFIYSDGFVQLKTALIYWRKSVRLKMCTGFLKCNIILKDKNFITHKSYCVFKYIVSYWLASWLNIFMLLGQLTIIYLVFIIYPFNKCCWMSVVYKALNSSWRVSREWARVPIQGLSSLLSKTECLKCLTLT